MRRVGAAIFDPAAMVYMLMLYHARNSIAWILRATPLEHLNLHNTPKRWTLYLLYSLHFGI